MTEDLKSKKALILETAREIKVQQWTPAEIDQLRRGSRQAGHGARPLWLARRSEAVARLSRPVAAVGGRRMNTSGVAAPGSSALELPPFSLDVQGLDLAGDVKAVGLELLAPEERE